MRKIKGVLIIPILIVVVFFIVIAGYKFKTHKHSNILNTQNDTIDMRLGYEVLKVKSLNTFEVWINKDLTQEQFNSIDLPLNWFKNGPREADADSAAFARSPSTYIDGDFIDKEHFGHIWRHNAKVVDINVHLPDDENLLKGVYVEKHHTVYFNTGKTLYLLTSPQGKNYIRISRDANRKSDVPSIPSKWKLSTYVTSKPLVITLPNPTLNIRANNEDSFQGPIDSTLFK